MLNRLGKDPNTAHKCFLVTEHTSHAMSVVLHVLADRQAQVLDFIQFNRRAALNSSLKHSNCSYLPPKDVAPGDDAIHMYPFDLSPQCEVCRCIATAWWLCN